MSLPHENSQNYGVKPVITHPYQDGATSARTNAIQYRNNQISQQQRINGTHSSGGKKIKKGKQRGGVLVVPQFPQNGPPVSGTDSNSTSISTNTTGTQQIANGTCDSCIGDKSNTTLCQSAACNPSASQSGGSKCTGSGLIPIGKTWGCMSGGKKTKKYTRINAGKKRKQYGCMTTVKRTKRIKKTKRKTSYRKRYLKKNKTHKVHNKNKKK